MKIRRIQSLSVKLTVWYIIILGIIVVLAGFFLYQGFKDGLIDDLDNILLEIADETSESWSRSRGVTWEDAIRKAESRFLSAEPFIQLVGLEEDGKRAVSSITHTERIPVGAFQLDTHLYYRADRSDIDSLVFETVKEEELSTFPIRVFLLPVRGPNVLQVGISLDDTMQSLNRLLIVMILAGLGLLLFASLGSSFIINRALHPVKSVVKTAQEITADDLSLRIAAQERQDEIGALVATFNGMIARLEKSVNKIRQFSGDVSHELRTPLTIIRGEVEVLLRKDRDKNEYIGTLRSVLEESFRMEKIIDDLLFLSRVEALEKSRLNRDVRLDTVLSQVIDDRKAAIQSKSLELRVGEASEVMVKGDEHLLERMLVNLLDNAIRYTPAGGSVSLSLSRSQSAALLEISDTGVGIPEDALPLIFDRFYVVDKSRSKETGGSGLGLSIVKWIADNHGADVVVESQVGQGTTVRISFPLEEKLQAHS
jgi:heavy metal sensor kinase